MLNSKALAATAAPKVYIEDVFSTWLYTGNGSAQTITNGIDLSGKGGLVWIKSRSVAGSHRLIDSARGVGLALSSDATVSQGTSGVTSFNSNGLTLDGFVGTNASSATYASWTFRKAAKFFDVVTYAGNGASSRALSHLLGSAPGTVIVKRTDASDSWWVWHRSITQNNNWALVLNSTSAAADQGQGMWGASNGTPDMNASTFSIGGSTTNANGGSFVAYLFAHDAGGFGDSGNDSVVKCGSWTDSGSGTQTITLGYEPQFVIYKQSDGANNWAMLDNMRGWPVVNATGSTQNLYPNLSNAETGGNYAGNGPTATGFNMPTLGGGTYIYIAIRRGPMKTPTDATKVFSADTSSGASSTLITTGFASDLAIYNLRGGAGANSPFVDRLRGLAANSSSTSQALLSSSTAAEGGYSVGYEFWNTGFRIGAYYGGSSNVFYSFRRAPGFFDVVAYRSPGGTPDPQVVNHNLQVSPELIIVKNRSDAYNWVVWQSSLGTSNLNLDTNSAAGISNARVTGATSTTFSVGTQGQAGGILNNEYIAYLFATLTGVSKVGSYTGTGTTLSIDCGFTNGARFVLIKRTDSTGDWYVWDTARGIISGNDPYLLLNSTAAEVTNTDYIDPLNSGFQISSTAPAAINANGGSFIYLAIA